MLTFRAILEALRASLIDRPFGKPKKDAIPTDIPTPPATPPLGAMDAVKKSPNPATPMSQLPGKIPNSQISESVDPLPIAQAALIQLQMMDRALLTEDTLWRDLYALTGTTRTFSGPENILAAWKKLAAVHKPHEFRIAPQGGVTVMRPMPTLSWIQVKYSFRTQGHPQLLCTGMIRLIPGEQEDWKIWCMTTVLQRIEGFPDVDFLEPVAQDERPPTPVSDDGTERVQDCVVVGAGMAGLCMAGYMKALGVEALVLEKNASIGQVWQDRYDSVSIHTSKGCGQLPFSNIWGPDVPYHLNAKHLVQGYSEWVRKYGIKDNIWLSTELLKASWNEVERNWTLRLKRRHVDTEITCKHLVFAVGSCSVKYMPTFPKQSLFKGKILHAEDYNRASEWKGLKAVVVGSANSGHDISNDMLLAGVDVTMYQRSPTPVIPIQHYSRVYDPVYNDEIPVHVSDGMMLSAPNAITRLMSQKALAKWQMDEKERFEALEKRGFRVVWGLDLYHTLLERFGSHYIDVGVSQKIADGLIKVKSGSLISEWTETGLRFEDGTELTADVVVFATGYDGNMKNLVSRMVEPKVAERLHDYWGVDDEGEVRGAWKPIGHPNIWYTGGNVLLMRYFAKFLAMSLAADLKGCPLPLYEKRY